MRRDRVRRGGVWARRRRSQGGAGAGAAGFTITELLVVVGLIAVLISLLLPVLGRARAAAQATACLSNLRQMTTAWTIYLTENRGRLPEYVFYTPMQPDVAYRSYWLGILDGYRVRGDALLCPAANEPIPYSQPLKGAGNVAHAWSGKLMSASVAKLTPKIYREGSYGYNQRLTAGGGYGADERATGIAAVKPLSEVPVFFDSTFLDARPDNGHPAAPVQPPPDLRGDNYPPGVPDHWRFLIARHGRAINVAMADGSATRVPLEDVYLLRWSGRWQKYTLSLPPY